MIHLYDVCVTIYFFSLFACEIVDVSMFSIVVQLKPVWDCYESESLTHFLHIYIYLIIYIYSYIYILNYIFIYIYIYLYIYLFNYIYIQLYIYMNIIPKRNVYLAAVHSTKLRTVSMKSPFSVFVAYVQHGYTCFSIR